MRLCTQASQILLLQSNRGVAGLYLHGMEVCLPWHPAVSPGNLTLAWLALWTVLRVAPSFQSLLWLLPASLHCPRLVLEQCFEALHLHLSAMIFKNILEILEMFSLRRTLLSYLKLRAREMKNLAENIFRTLSLFFRKRASSVMINKVMVAFSWTFRVDSAKPNACLAGFSLQSSGVGRSCSILSSGCEEVITRRWKTWVVDGAENLQCSELFSEWKRKRIPEK